MVRARTSCDAHPHTASQDIGSSLQIRMAFVVDLMKRFAHLIKPFGPILLQCLEELFLIAHPVLNRVVAQQSSTNGPPKQSS